MLPSGHTGPAEAGANITRAEYSDASVANAGYSEPPEDNCVVRTVFGQWLCLSWQSCLLRHQRSAVRHQASANF